MTGPTLMDAINVVNERKAASGMTSPGAPYSFDDHTAILGGTDLTPDEVLAVGGWIAGQALPAFAFHASRGLVVEGLAGLWIDGVVHGLVLADLRRQAGA